MGRKFKKKKKLKEEKDKEEKELNPGEEDNSWIFRDMGLWKCRDCRSCGKPDGQHKT